jgi:hypothetical protein
MVKWIGYPSDQNTWEPPDHFDRAMLLEFENGLKAKKAAAAAAAAAAGPKSGTKRGAASDAGAGSAEPAAPPVMQRIARRTLLPGGADYDLQEERCFMCRHPCFYTMVVSSHPTASVEGDEGEEPIPLACCLSPNCLNELPVGQDQRVFHTLYSSTSMILTVGCR